MSEERKGSKGMDEKERFSDVCKPFMERLEKQIERGFSELSVSIDSLDKAINVGNGQPSIKQRLATGDEKMKQYDRVLAGIAVWLSVVSSGLVVAGIIAIVQHF